jgi:hypothetical protein
MQCVCVRVRACVQLTLNRATPSAFISAASASRVSKSSAEGMKHHGPNVSEASVRVSDCQCEWMLAG